MNTLKVIAISHKTVDIPQIGKFHLEDAVAETRLHALKAAMGAKELMYLSTCNRVEFIFSSPEPINNQPYLIRFFESFGAENAAAAAQQCLCYEGEEAYRHLLQVAASVDSVIVGEREIITQVRTAYEKCKTMGLTGDLLRIVMRTTIETAKKVFTDTQIASKPVSVVSLAYKKLRELNVPLDARFLIIGAGQTNMLMAKFLKKHGFKNFSIYNRTLANAQKLADELNGTAHKLADIAECKNGFDVILTCTAASEHIISAALYRTLLNNETDKKIIIDLSVPTDTDPMVLATFNLHFIDVATIQAIANENMQERKKELSAVHHIIESAVKNFEAMHKVRKVELAMSEVPKKIKEIRETAVKEVFAKELENLDEQSKEVLDKILAYVEKKYITVPMKMAREIIIEN